MDRRIYRERLEALRQAHQRAPAPRPAWTDAAEDFASFTAGDYRRRLRLHPDVAWEDACRVYALAAATHPEYDGLLDLHGERRLQDQWQALQGEGGPDWTLARTMLRETWRWLDEHAGTHRVH